jgi:hypothetical protein
MGTLLPVMLVMDHSSLSLRPEDLEVGDRVDVRVLYTDDGWKAVRLREWRGRKDQVHGFIEEVFDGDVRGFRVFDTKVQLPMSIDFDDHDGHDWDDDHEGDHDWDH